MVMAVRRKKGAYFQAHHEAGDEKDNGKAQTTTLRDRRRLIGKTTPSGRLSGVAEIQGIVYIGACERVFEQHAIARRELKLPSAFKKGVKRQAMSMIDE